MPWGCLQHAAGVAGRHTTGRIQPRGCLQHAAGVAGRHTMGRIQPRRGDRRKAHRKGRPPSIAPAAASQVAGIDGPSFGRCFALTRSQPSSAPGADCIGGALDVGEDEAMGLLSSPMELLPPLPKKGIDPIGDAGPFPW
ncbi:uncharacterized protein [Miscanthus floridulus]|uniref:uncharacterized protein isoform X1 n=1 Tax=Miscanthus floridulus TaxID=154761 RepID=UPI00345982A7